MVLIWIGIVILIIALSGFRILVEYERVVVFTLGRYNRTMGPGIAYFVPFVEKVRKIDLRLKTADIPQQEAMTKDNIPVMANTVVYYRVEKPVDAVIKIEDYEYAVQQYTQAALRDVIGNSDLDTVLQEREKVANQIKKLVDKETAEWGVDIASIKIQELGLPESMRRAMAKQAEAERERRAMLISAQGELEASKNLAKASANLNAQALHLRTLQTIRDISTEPSEKIVLFMPSGIGDIVEKVTRTKRKKTN